MNRKKLAKCTTALGNLALFLNQQRSIYDVCMVDFITRDIFKNGIKDQGIKNDLLQLTQQQIIELPKKMTQKKDDTNNTKRFLISQ